MNAPALAAAPESPLATDAADQLSYDSGSYRDRDGRVFYGERGEVLRGLSATALEQWSSVAASSFWEAVQRDGRVIGTELAAPSGTESTRETGHWAGVLRHEALPFVSYPYEWSFGMLQDAALLHLQLLADALRDDVTIKDGTAYNVQWRGARPVFIDVASFERLTPGQPWAGYRQFCQTFLYPLMLQAYKRAPFHAWLRGRLDGITPEDFRGLMSFRDLFRRGVATHVLLHAWLQARPAVEQVDASRALPRAGFSKAMIQSNIAGLTRLIRGLRWKAGRSTWSEYSTDNSYEAADRRLKADFVRSVVRSQRWKRVWDLGSNTGEYSRIAAENADLVVALDADHLAIERLYQSLKGDADEASSRILPLVVSLVDPSCGVGWRGCERRGLTERGRPDLTLCLALIHHLVIGHGVPLGELVDWLSGLGSALVIEFVSKQDPMVQRLLRGRRDIYPDYLPEAFESHLTRNFRVERSSPLDCGTRTLYFAVPRGRT